MGRTSRPALIHTARRVPDVIVNECPAFPTVTRVTRIDVTFRSGEDDCAAWLYTPESGTEPRPVVVMAHGLAGVKEERLDAFAERFEAVGYACLVFDYRHFGASGGEPRQILDVGDQLADWRAAVAYARSLDGVDPDRVVIWGTSFAGGHVIVTAAHDSRIAAVISQCPFTDGLASSIAMPPKSSAKVTALAIGDVVGSRLGRPPITVPSFGPPGSTALMTTPDAVAGASALLPEDFDVRIDVAARFGFQILRYHPGRRARDVLCPILFIVAERDSVAPPGRTQHWVAQAPRGEVVLTLTGHFDLYVGDAFETNIARQLDFLNRHVPVG